MITRRSLLAGAAAAALAPWPRPLSGAEVDELNRSTLKGMWDTVRARCEAVEAGDRVTEAARALAETIGPLPREFAYSDGCRVVITGVEPYEWPFEPLPSVTCTYFEPGKAPDSRSIPIACRAT